MTFQISTGSVGSGVDPDSATRTSAPRANELAPVIAGARARGIADAFEMIGEGAVLLDFSGAVLHIGDVARPMLGPALQIAGDHVVAASRKAAEPLEALIEAGLSDHGPRALEIDLLCVEEGMRQRVRLMRAPGGACQLLAAVLVLEPPRRVRRQRRTRGNRALGEAA